MRVSNVAWALLALGSFQPTLPGQREQAGGDFLVEHLAVVGRCGEDQVVLGLVERFDGEERERQPARLADEGLEQRDLAVVLAVVEVNLGWRQLAAFACATTASASGWFRR